MRKHHNKLYYGLYRYKTVFNMASAALLWPTTDEHLTDVKNKNLLFHASVELKDEKFIQMGSRAVAVVGHGESIWEAEQIAEKNISKIKGPLFHRKDIGTTELIQQKINHMVSIK